MSLQLADLFTDHAVLQQGRPLPVWGWAPPGAEVEVAFAGQRQRGVADTQGRWEVRLAPLAASRRPRNLTAKVVGKRGTVTVRDLLIGEVWVCSGQSNMQWAVANANNPDVEIPAANYPLIRLFDVPRVAKVERQDRVAATWQVCTPETVPTFSAVAYFFGRELLRRLDVPVGLINSSWGGTIAEAWTSREGLLADATYRPVVERYDESLKDYEQRNAAYVARMREGEGNYYPRDPGNQGHPRGWADPATDTSAWPTIKLPQLWQQAGHDFNGVVWFRREVELPADWAGKPLTLELGAIDKGDITYFNNEPVGQLDPLLPNAWCTPRRYPVPGHLAKAGRNTVAVRVVSHVFGGGLSGPAALMRLAPADSSRAPLPLAGEWHMQVEHNYGRVAAFPGIPAPQGPGNANSPYILFNSMIAPLVPYAIRGATWYQGESNAGKAFAYRSLLPALIRDWHRVWGQGEFPFLIVQLANYMARRDEPQECAWAELRDAQLQTARTVPQAGLAVIIDIGEATDIHPRNKQDVGARLAAWALAHTYQVKGVVASGPLYRDMTREGSRLRLSFDYVDGGLVARGGELQGFAVAGADRRFHWAQARIEGERIVVWSDAVAAPVAARYAWADNPLCNLYNQAGLPASPFRTDTWPGVTDQTPA